MDKAALYRAGYSPWGRKELETLSVGNIERLSTHAREQA